MLPVNWLAADGVLEGGCDVGGRGVGGGGKDIWGVGVVWICEGGERGMRMG